MSHLEFAPEDAKLFYWTIYINGNEHGTKITWNFKTTKNKHFEGKIKSKKVPDKEASSLKFNGMTEITSCCVESMLLLSFRWVGNCFKKILAIKFVCDT